MEARGKRVRDFLLMLKAGREVFRAELNASRELFPRVELLLSKEDMDEAALEEAICCVEAVYREIEPKVGRKPEIRLPVSFVRNRLMVPLNFYCSRLYGYFRCHQEECPDRMSGCPETCRFRGWEDEYCRMLREAIRCVEVIGTGVPEPPTISFEDLR